MMKVALPKWLLETAYLASPNQWIEDEKQIALLLMLKLMLFAVASLW